jgi:hypothetical protein
MMNGKFPTKMTLAIALAIILLAAAGCSAGAQFDLHLMPLEEMPTDVQAAPVTVQQAYQFAAANPDLMQQLPCYCGCGAVGHKSNYDCYISDVDEKGLISFDSHALGCSICVDITQDAMRLIREGKSLAEITSYVDATYSQYGPSTMP